MKTRSKIFTLFSMGVTAVLLSVVTGCNEDPTNNPVYIDNPNVNIIR